MLHNDHVCYLDEQIECVADKFSIHQAAAFCKQKAYFVTFIISESTPSLALPKLGRDSEKV